MAKRILTEAQIGELAVARVNELGLFVPFPPEIVITHEGQKLVWGPKDTRIDTNMLILSDEQFTSLVLDPLLSEMTHFDRKRPEPPPLNAYRVPRPEDVRGSTHGDYGQMSRVIQETKAIWRSGPSWSQLSAAQKEALELIATKVGRIVCGDPNHRDHWDDVAGYARKSGETIPTKKE